MSSSTVHVQQAILITPSHPTPHCTLPLSAVDSQLFLRFTFEYLLLFHPHRADAVAVTRSLKSALSQILVPYYPLAGRVRKRADGLGLEVLCRAQGAIFIDAISNSTVSDFAGGTAALECREFLALHIADVLVGAPPLVLQLTWLSDGGGALAAGFNHCLCDGVGSAEFLNSLAALSRGLTELCPKPVWNRTLLNPSPRANSLNHHPEFIAVPDVSQFSLLYSKQRLVVTSTTFHKNILEELKTQIKLTQTTSFEALAAHIWRSWARSLNLVPEQIIKLVFSINIRRRVTPSLPDGYYGNAMVLGCAQTRAGELTGKDLRYAAELVGRAKTRVGDEYVREVVESVSRGGASVDSVGTLVVTQWTRLGLDRVDFGVGRPVWVGPVCGGKYCILSPVYEATGGVRVDIGVPAGCVDRFLCLLRCTRGW